MDTNKKALYYFEGFRMSQVEIIFMLNLQRNYFPGYQLLSDNIYLKIPKEEIM